MLRSAFAEVQRGMKLPGKCNHGRRYVNADDGGTAFRRSGCECSRAGRYIEESRPRLYVSSVEQGLNSPIGHDKLL